MGIEPTNEWLETMNRFRAHWSAVNAALSPAELTLNGGYTLAGGFEPDIQEVDNRREAVQDQLNVLSIARADRNILRTALGQRLRQFRSAVNAFLPGSTYLISIPYQPLAGASAGVWKEATDEVAHLWDTINGNVPPVAGFVPPLLLAGGYARADFVADADELSGFYRQVSNATQVMRLTRVDRNRAFLGPRSRMIQYRLAVQGSFPAGHELLLTLPPLGS